MRLVKTENEHYIFFYKSAIEGRKYKTEVFLFYKNSIKVFCKEQSKYDFKISFMTYVRNNYPHRNIFAVIWIFLLLKIWKIFKVKLCMITLRSMRNNFRFCESTFKYFYENQTKCVLVSVDICGLGIQRLCHIKRTYF